MATGEPLYLKKFFIRSLKNILRRLEMIDQALGKEVPDARYAFQVKPWSNTIHLSLLLSFLFGLFSLPGQKDWTSNKYRRISSNRNSYDQGKGEVMDNSAAHDKKSHYHK